MFGHVPERKDRQVLKARFCVLLEDLECWLDENAGRLFRDGVREQRCENGRVWPLPGAPYLVIFLLVRACSLIFLSNEYSQSGQNPPHVRQKRSASQTWPSSPAQASWVVR